ncbi:MAG: serine/threonine-protein kinase [Ktedonobacterales bacterium]
MPDGIRDLIGQQLQQYLVTASLYIGGEYRYLRATDTSNQRSTMLVILPPKIFEARDALTLLSEECFRIQALKQAHLLPVYYVGMWNTLVYVVIPPIRESLSNFLLREKLMVPSHAVRIVTDLAWALQTLHSAGLIHGDIQPGNLFYDETGVLYLADFGIMRAMAREQEHVRHGEGSDTTAPLALPSPYKAPELVGPRIELSVSGDIYALGAILHEMITGVTPRTLHPDEPIPLPSESDLDQQQRNALDAAIRRALAQDPSQRFPDARAFAVALRVASGSKTMPPARSVSLTNALAGVWHVPGGSATDDSAQQLIAALFSVREPATGGETPSRPLRRTVGVPNTAASVGISKRARRGQIPSKRLLILAIAVVLLVLLSIVGAITMVNGNVLQILEPGTATPQVTPTDASTATSMNTATSTVPPSATSKLKASPATTRSR